MIPVCAAVLRKDGRVLLARRAPHKKMGGLWEFPGGRIEEGETPAVALARELREEFKIEAVVGAELARAKHTYDFGEIELIALAVDSFTGTLTLTDHDQVEWLEPRRLLNFKLTPADVPIARALKPELKECPSCGSENLSFDCGCSGDTAKCIDCGMIV